MIRILSLPSVLLAAAFSPALPAQTCNNADRAVLLVLDASGSMNAAIPGGGTRMAAAQRAVKEVAGMVAADAQLGLRIYGASSPAKDKDCEESRVAVPFAPARAQGAAIATAVEGARAQGWTPIAHSLEQAVGDFPAAARERAIVLVSDGKETCKGDPVLAAKALAAKGIVIHAVGFVVDTAAKMQLQAVARASGGTYFDAPRGHELPETLKSAINACPAKAPEVKVAKAAPGKLRTTESMWLSKHEVLDAETGRKVGALDSANREIRLPAGVYEVRFGPASWKGIEVRDGETTTISPAVLKVSKAVSAKLVDSETGAEHGSFNAVLTSATVMPGVYDLVFRGNLRWPHLKLDGGETVVLEPVEVKLASGLKYKSARILHEGRPVARFDAVTSRHTLPPGHYVIELDGRPRPFSAPKGGETLEVGPD